MRSLFALHEEDEFDISRVDKYRVLITITKKGANPENKVQMLMGVNTLVALEETIGGFIETEVTVVKELRPSGTDISIRAKFNEEFDEC